MGLHSLKLTNKCTFSYQATRGREFYSCYIGTNMVERFYFRIIRERILLNKEKA